jgi:hypothetical protein
LSFVITASVSFISLPFSILLTPTGFTPSFHYYSLTQPGHYYFIHRHFHVIFIIPSFHCRSFISHWYFHWLLSSSLPFSSTLSQPPAKLVIADRPSL